MRDGGVLGTCGLVEGVRRHLEGEAPAGRFQEEKRGRSPWLSLVMVMVLKGLQTEKVFLVEHRRSASMFYVFSLG